jgi:hypothetical protein
MSINSRNFTLVPPIRIGVNLTPLRNKRLKKEIIDAWVDDWHKTNRAKPSEHNLVAEIISRLTVLSDAGLRVIQHEIALALSLRSGKGE